MNQPKKIAVIGATGSIGRQTLDIIDEHPELYQAAVLVAGSNVDALVKYARRFHPSYAVIADESKHRELSDRLKHLEIKTAAGAQAIADIVTLPAIDTVVMATVGYSGLAPTIRAIKAGKDIALANKETLVVAGALIARMLESSTSRIMPIDSEHSAIYQCLVGEKPESVRRLILTASGGPFRTFTTKQLKKATVADALHHPKWNMGEKVTIDSATMMNKAFEIIEARWLFNIDPARIAAVIHPQSIVHSMVEFVDGAIKAQLGLPDMHLPIRYALGDASRMETTSPILKLKDLATLTFEEPDSSRFPCLSLGHYALARGGNTACVINAANEVAVDAFLRERIGFMGIYPIISQTLEQMPFIQSPSYDDYVNTNTMAREYAMSLVNKKI